MLGLSKIQLGLLTGAGLLIVCLGAYGAYANHQLGQKNQEIGILKQAKAQLTQTVKDTEKDKELLRQEILHRDELIAQVQSDYDELNNQEREAVVEIREIFITDPEAAECGNAPLPESIVDFVHQYQARAGSDDGNGEGVPTKVVNEASTGS